MSNSELQFFKFLPFLRRRMLSSEQSAYTLDQSIDSDANQLGMMNDACRTSEAWIVSVFCLHSVSLFAALIIQTAQHRLIDIQESPLISAEQEFSYDENIPKITIRRHSLQDNRSNETDFFEQQFAQHIRNNSELNGSTGWNEEASIRCNSNRRCHVNALNWLKSFNVIRDRSQDNRIPQKRRYKMILRKTSSENELLLMTPSNDPSVDDMPAIRRSFSSGLLF